MMKRIAPLLAALLMLSSCGGNTPEVSPIDLDIYEDSLIYPAEEVSCFTVDEDGFAYMVEPVVISSDKVYSTITVCDLHGEKVEEYEIAVRDSIKNICVGSGMIYFAAWEANPIIAYNVEGLYSYDLKTGEIKRLETLSNAFTLPSAIKKLAFLDGKLYILGVHENYLNMEYESWEGDSKWGSSRYTYDGTVLAAYDLKNDTFEIVYDDLISDFTLTPDGRIMIYAHDSVGGMFFAELDPQKMSTEERAYCELYNLNSFAADGHGIMFSTSDVFGITLLGSLYYRSLENDSSISEMAQDIVNEMAKMERDHIAYYGGFTFYCTQEKKLTRLKNAAYIKETPAIKMIGVYENSVPPAGYNVDFAALGDDQFALTVLSRGTAYDACYIQSQHDFAHNLKEKGAFYPLNDVPGVLEFLDACFPYIKDAATDKDGNIWMIPVDTTVLALAYNIKNCQSAGISFDGSLILDDLLANVKTASELDPEGLNYSLSTHFLLGNYLTKYLRSNATLDTQEFRDLAAMFKGFGLAGTQWGGRAGLTMFNLDDSNLSTELINPNFLFEPITDINQITIVQEDFRAAPITGTETPSIASCVFLSVNPDSNNLSATLDYITAVCEYLMTLKDSFMLADPATYTDSEYMKSLYALYENSVIDFNIPNEVFMENFVRYLQGEIDIDTMIAEADRKLAMYRGE